jgi:hypothetical protein
MFYLEIIGVIADRQHDIVQEAHRQAAISGLVGDGLGKTYAQYAKTARIASKALAKVAKALEDLENHTHKWEEFLGHEYCAHCGIKKNIHTCKG